MVVMILSWKPISAVLTNKFSIMETMINTLSAQAAELIKNQYVVAMLNDCATEEEKQMKLAIAAMYAIVKANA